MFFLKPKQFWLILLIVLPILAGAVSFITFITMPQDWESNSILYVDVNTEMELTNRENIERTINSDVMVKIINQDMPQIKKYQLKALSNGFLALAVTTSTKYEAEKAQEYIFQKATKLHYEISKSVITAKESEVIYIEKEIKKFKLQFNGEYFQNPDIKSIYVNMISNLESKKISLLLSIEDDKRKLYLKKLDGTVIKPPLNIREVVMKSLFFLILAFMIILFTITLGDFMSRVKWTRKQSI